ncbi:GH14866 [Drosophila grimshawi]|uniref:GH14866 n=1 Tax=Drosophila grimshawi TaxID=7222 RepID=B4J2I7_DROGR|nr:GH14866 [Drosophila grimshawi]
MRCAVRNCGNNNRNRDKKKWRYFHFPKDKEQLQKWIEFCDRKIVNTATACICNEHFTADDFERNMQYEFGFTRKNPTKLKPGSNPSLNEPYYKPAKTKIKGKRSRVKKDAPQSNLSREGEAVEGETLPELESKYSDSIQFELFDCVDDLKERAESVTSQEQSYDMIEYINETEEYANDFLSDDEQMQLEILDKLNAQSDAEHQVEIIDAERDNYARHLESEVSRLKRQVFFLQDERKKLKDEIENLRATVRNSRLKQGDALENLNNKMVCLLLEIQYGFQLLCNNLLD